MRDTVLIPGCPCWHTRSEIEQAVKDLDKPEPFKHLDRVRMKCSGRKGIVLIGDLQKEYAKSIKHFTNPPEGSLTIVDDLGQGYTYSRNFEFISWELDQ